MKHLAIKSFGPITHADIRFGDLTIFVGPQASGKSIALQLLKLIIDKKHIRRTLTQYGFIWNKRDVSQILDRYFGEGMSGIWTDTSEVLFNGKHFQADFLLPRKREDTAGAVESLFYIPAQRVICLQNGWPRFFTEYEDSVPYILRHFSETLRLLLERGLDKKDIIFPQPKRLKEPLRISFNDSIFHNGKVIIDKTTKKRFKLEIGNSSLPFMTWSAGQKEFMPLLLGFYWLCPSTAISKRDYIDYVVIEEPEMGLHPKAISSVILQIMDLMRRGYKVIVSTHSPVLLEFAWALGYLQKNSADISDLAALFELKNLRPSMKELLKSALSTKIIKTYYFDQQSNNVTVKDISTLDPGNGNEEISEWGGLSSFSARASNIISTITANAQ